MRKVLFEVDLATFELLREAAFLDNKSKSAWIRDLVIQTLKK